MNAGSTPAVDGRPAVNTDAAPVRMQPFTVVSGPAPHIARPNLDTDIIIRIERLTALAKEELGPYAFEALRTLADGTPAPDFVLNQPRFLGAPILLAAENFGCGSSREAAVWALQGIGIRCVIAPSFGDIFAGNCFQNGVLPIRLPAAQIDALAADASQGAHVVVDLTDCTVTSPTGQHLSFAVDPMRRECLLEGLDDIGLTLKDDSLVREWQRHDRQRRPWIWP